MEDVPLNELYKRWHGTLKSYWIGLFMSVILTLAAFFFVFQHVLSGWALKSVVLGLGGIQAVAQLLFFLHIGTETKPRWYLYVFLFMITFFLIVVLGSFWIMFDLNERVM